MALAHGQRGSSSVRAQHSTRTEEAPCFNSTRAHASAVAPVVITSSTRITGPVGDALPHALARAEGASHIAEAMGAGKPAAAPGRAMAHQPGGEQARARCFRKGMGDQPGLVIAAPPQAPAGQWHRDDHRVFNGQPIACRQPDVPSHDSRQMRPAAVFETHQYAAGQVVIAHCRPRLGNGGALIDARCAQRAFIRRQREQDAAGGASRRTDEVQPCPARGAERIVLLNHQSARQATWRQRKPGRPYQGLDQTSDKRGLSNGHTGVIAET